MGRAAALAGSKKLKAIPLKVSAPFHCALMAPAARAVEVALSKLTLQTPRFPVVANVSAEPNLSAEEAKRLLVRQIDGPVLWEQTIALMADAGVSHALEIGPGDEVVLQLDENELRITTRRLRLAKAKAMVQRLVPAETSLVDELIQERREAAARE